MEAGKRLHEITGPVYDALFRVHRPGFGEHRVWDVWANSTGRKGIRYLRVRLASGLPQATIDNVMAQLREISPGNTIVYTRIYDGYNLGRKLRAKNNNIKIYYVARNYTRK